MQQISVMLTTALAFALAMALNLAEASGASLRDRALVTGDQVMLGDLFEGLDVETAAIPVATAPADGHEVVLPAGWIARVARAFDIGWRADRQAEITIRRVTAAERAQLAQATIASLSTQIAAAQVSFRPPEPEPAPAPEPVAPEPEPEPEPVAAPPAPAPEPVAEEPETVSLPVLRRAVRRGYVIDRADIVWAEVDSRRRIETLVNREADLVGMAVRRSLPAMTPLQLHDVEKPMIVKRGDTVAMILETGALSITAKGRAMASAGMGDVVEVMNSDSGNYIDAVVTGRNTVSVRLSSHTLLAQQN